MEEFSVHVGYDHTDAEVVALYDSVGWTNYTTKPEVLVQAIRGSGFVVSCRDGHGRLVGLARAISDDATVCFVQDILVEPAFQGSGAGRAMLEAVQARYAHVRQTVLITDDDTVQRAFYQALGFTEGSDFSTGPLRMFAKFR
ncbi:GNAT family N-acetyltransferase [Arthrobacter oryzae]|uniref:GNAT family N-acetyltransferase n=1 Tax=Arthrobacter oryzae TaxID=409290 RepID=UPI00285E319A|nr:GNAT family N-acetyltransferase [Arthrobacter oryzae]MDR6507510.1 GNAT superfamily N-acetyltransferase [Arthrobacter oryzae]